MEMKMKRNNDLQLVNIGGQDILVPLGAKVADLNGIIVLNNTGRYIWELLAENHSVDDLTVAIVDCFDVETERARSDVQAFVAEIAKWEGIEA
jgi:hypothetical protein